MVYTVKCTNIRWNVTDEDVLYGLPPNASEDEIAYEVERVKQKLDTTATLKLEADSKDEITDDYVSDELSEQSGWLNEGFDYEIV